MEAEGRMVGPEESRDIPSYKDLLKREFSLIWGFRWIIKIEGQEIGRVP